MTGTIIEFPETMQRQWRVFERDVSAMLAQLGHAPDVIEHAMGKLKPAYLKYARPESFSGSPDEVVEALNTWHHRIVSGLMVEVVLRDITLFNNGIE